MGSDFNGDGRDDILWRNRFDGKLSNWLADEEGGFGNNDAKALITVPLDWRVGGTGDFNGDGRDDVLWLDFAGNQLSNWLGTEGGGFLINDAAAMTALPPGWFVAAVGDLSDDGRDDLFLVNENTGARWAWFAKPDGGFSMGVGIGGPDPPRYIFNDPIGDFNGDGSNEVLWYDPASGSVGIYWNYFGDLTANPAVSVRASAGWWPVATADFNGDGNDDILWRHDQGALSNWLGNDDGSFTINDANAFTNVPTNWAIVGTGDYDGDGKADILWRNFDNGAFSNWLGTDSGGFEINDDDAFNVAPLDWSIQPNLAGIGEWDY